MKGSASKQKAFPQVDEFFLSQRLEESRALVREVAQRSERPLIIQFSGGKDSMALVGLVREVTDRFICSYMVSGIEFPESIDFATKMARELGAVMLFSNPSNYKGGFFERLEQFRTWPTIRKLWCQRDLKVRAQKKVLEANFGKSTFYKLNGVRRFESYRRRYIYNDNEFLREDRDHKGSYMVFPLLKWTDADVFNYLNMAGLPSSGLYKRFGVSGCYWCPFYQPAIYRRILGHLPNLYDQFIEWEGKLDAPSVIGQIYLRDLKKEVVDKNRLEGQN